MTSHSTRVVAATVAVAALAAASPAGAQEPATRPPVLRIVQTSPASVVTGELASVDTTARMLVVKTAEGREERLAYTDRTKVSGTQTTLASLATATPAQVSVRFAGSGANRVATEITLRDSKP